MELRILFLSIFFPFLVVAQPTTNSNFALLIGISHFQDEKWGELHGQEDVEKIAETLWKEKGFSIDNIQLCLNEQATKNGIISELEQLQTSVETGSMVYIHFSTHGQQLLDDDIDPKEESDGLDECLVTYNCPFVKEDDGISSNPAYKGENHLRDDDIRVLTDNIRRKVGPTGQVLVIIDACHSGTASRGMNDSKQFIIPSLWFGKPQPENLKAEPLKKSWSDGNTNTDNAAPLLTIFAALPGQSVYDRVFSEAVDSCFKSAGANTTCSSFFKAIELLVKSKSSTMTPNADGLDVLGTTRLFGGALADPISYFEVKEVSGDKLLRLGQGTFANLFKGTKLVFFPQGTRNLERQTVQALATGEVISSTEFEAKVNIQLMKGVGKDELRTSWAYISKWVISDQRLSINLKLEEGALKKALRKRLTQNQNFTIDSPNKTGIIIQENQELLQIFDSTGLVLHKFGKAAGEDDVSEDVERFLLQYQRFITLKGLKYQNQEVKVDWRIYPSQCTQRCEEQRGKASCTPQTDHYEMQLGDCFGIEITNNSKREIFFSILDFQATQFEPNVDMLMIPPAGESPESFSIKPGKTWKSSDFSNAYCWKMGPIPGQETFKLITSLSPVHLRNAVKSRSFTQEQEHLEEDNLFDVQDIQILVKK